MRHRLIRYTLFLIILLKSYAHSTAYTFKGLDNRGGSLQWSNSNSWDPTGVPNSSTDTATIPSTYDVIWSNNWVSLDQDVTLHGLSMLSDKLEIQTSSKTITFAGTSPFIYTYKENPYGVQGNRYLIEANVSLDTDLNVIVFSNATAPAPNTYTLHITGNLLGGNTLIKSGPSDLVVSSSTVEVDFLISEGRLVFDVPSNISYSDVISGPNPFVKQRPQQLTITSAQTLTGGIYITDGTITLSSSGDIASSELINISSGATLQLTDGIGSRTINNVSGAGNVNLGNNTLSVNTSTESTLSGVISGSGALTKTGSSQFNLAGVNTYTGATTVSTGILFLQNNGSISSSSSVAVNATLSLGGDQSIQDLSGSGTVNLEGSTLTLTNGGSTFSGVISDGTNTNAGSLIKTGSGTSTLTGANTFTGNLTVNGGSLAVSNTMSYTGATTIGSSGTLSLTSSADISNAIATIVNGTLDFQSSTGTSTIQNLSGSGSLVNNGTSLTVSGSTNTTFSGAITGTGDLIKTGTNTLTLSGTSSSFAGDAQVSAGTLSVTGNLAGSITVNSGGTLGGTGTVGGAADTLTNGGVVAPGTSIGTLNVTGGYSQTGSGNLIIEIEPGGTSDQVIASGGAVLAGTLTIAPQPGYYQPNTAFTFLTAASITGEFDILSERSQVTGVITYPSGTSAVYTLSNAVPVLPVPTVIDPLGPNAGTVLKGNAKRIAPYLFRVGPAIVNADLLTVYNTILGLDSVQFPLALEKLGPTQFGALPLVSLQSDVLVSDSLVQNWKNFALSTLCVNDDKEKGLDRFVWAEPLMINYNQKAYQQEDLEQQIKFNSIVYGMNAGFSHEVIRNLFLSGQVAYTHANLVWEKHAGNAKWSSVYFGPSIGYLYGCNGYVTFLLQGAVNFYDVDRGIVIPGINRIASNRHNSYDLLARADAGYSFMIRKFFVQPEASFSYLTIFQEKYTEEGANSLDLIVFSKYSVFFRPQVDCRFGFNLKHKKVDIIPALKLGWLSNIPVTDGFYHARLRNETFASGNQFPVLSFHHTTNQLLVGAEFNIESEGFNFSFTYNGNYLDRYALQEGKIRFDWFF